jgi:hypothetical protein
MLTQGMKHKALSGSRRSSSISTDDNTGCGTAVGRLIKNAAAAAVDRHLVLVVVSGP